MKRRFTREEHNEMGAMLAAMRDDLVRREVQMSNAYPHTFRAIGRVRAAYRAIDQARSELENALASEDESWEVSVYYPHHPRRVITLAPREGES